MIIFKKTLELQNYLHKSNKTIGFVPTMGALHEGHLSLIKMAHEKAQLIVCSIFVNPTQFNDPKDFEKYPKTIEQDIELLISVGCDILFLPEVLEMYPLGYDHAESFEFGAIEQILEGAHRPGHFKGVGQVVARLLTIVMPNFLFLGQKDLQQCFIIKSLIDKMNLSAEIQTIIAPTIREKEGLAMSSRNRRLTEDEHKKALTISQSLYQIKNGIGNCSFESVKKTCENDLINNGFKVEYIALLDFEKFSLLENFNTQTKMAALIAASIGNVRLIDNLLLN